MNGGNRLFAVEGPKSKKYFDLKGAAKKHRDKLISQGVKDAHVTYGPDHPKHKANRKPTSWNKGKHPKKGWNKGKAAQYRAFVKHG
jgi:hypothetical protein